MSHIEWGFLAAYSVSSHSTIWYKDRRTTESGPWTPIRLSCHRQGRMPVQNVLLCWFSIDTIKYVWHPIIISSLLFNWFAHHQTCAKQPTEYLRCPALLHPTWLHEFSVPPGCCRSVKHSGNEAALAFLSLSHIKGQWATKRSASGLLPGTRFSHPIYIFRSASIF